MFVSAYRENYGVKGDQATHLVGFSTAEELSSTRLCACKFLIHRWFHGRQAHDELERSGHHNLGLKRSLNRGHSAVEAVLDTAGHANRGTTKHDRDRWYERAS
jgi:hypothetical protein